MRSTVTVLLLLAVSYSRSDDDKIIGGYECPPHSQPWQIYLTYDDGQRWCGASLINEKWAVSAAHCYIPPSRLALHLGEHHVFIEEGTEQRIWAEKVIPHPDYNKETFDNDIMLIKLSQPAVLNAFVQPIPLATTCAKEGDQCLVSGWGDQSINDVNYASVLQCLDVPVLPRSTCEASIPQNITENMFCAGFFEGGKDSCQGDSGGPIVCNGKLQGVVSWGIMCAMPDLPGVYVEVCRYGDWIKDIMANN
ncbi:anionic trypsin-2-like [Hoplias malabaricus]|uniref:anionic trypsin-2-like n=1 Tax=Hoplias malabaricus TaxID=27720 RepID=UPI003462050B